MQYFRDLDIDAGFLYESMIETIDDYVYAWNADRNIFVVSPGMATDFQIERQMHENWIISCRSLIHRRDWDRVAAQIDEVSHSDKSSSVLEFRMLTSEGRYVWMRNSVYVKRDPATGRAVHVFGVLHNMEQSEDVDFVTGLFKFSHGKSAFEKALAGGPDCSGHLLLLGIDDFAAINTLKSHKFGDKVLRATAQDILDLLPSGVLLYRFEGDQLLVVANNHTADEVQELYAQVKEYSSQEHCIDGVSYRFTISAGMVAYPGHGDTWSDLEKGLTFALKMAKESGRGQCVEFTKELFEARLLEQMLGSCLEESAHNDFEGYRAVYQPVCLTGSLEVKGAEALMRFCKPDGSNVAPDTFIPLLETTQLIVPVGMWMLEQAIAACKKWTAYLPDFVMNVNVSYVQLGDPDFCSNVEALLAKYDLDARNLVLELTESQFIAGDAAVSATLDRLKALRIPLAMDDFGTGYSSLGRLAEFEVDLVKIDRLFVQALNRSQYNYDFVDSVVRLCHNVGMRVCVEGVETREEQESVCMLNPDFVQGYYVSKPLEKDDFFQKFVETPYDSASIAVDLDKEKLQKQLAGDRELLNAMTNATPLCLVLWNRDFEMLACNDEAVKLFEAASQQDLLEHFFEFSPEQQPSGQSSRKAIVDALGPAFIAGRTEFSWVHCLRDGEEIPVEVTAVRLPYQDDYIVASFTRDLREQIAAEENDKRFRRRLKALLDATPLCLNLWTPDLQNVMCNQEAVKLFDLKNEQEYLDRFYELSPEYQPDGRLSQNAAASQIAEAMKVGRVQFPWMHTKLDGEPIPAEITLVRIEGLGDDGADMVAGYTRDLREQVQAERQSEKFRERLEALLDATPLCLNLWNSELENIMCNHAAVELFDLVNEQEYLDRFNELSPERQPDGRLSSEAAVDYIVEAMEKGRIQFKWMHQKPNGEPIPAEITLVRIKDFDDESFMVAGYTRDLREQMLLEQAERTIASRTRAMINASPLACLLWSQNGKIIDCNQVAVDLLGAKDTEDVEKNFGDFLPIYQIDGSESLKKKEEKFKEVMDRGRVEFEWLYMNRNKEEIPCEVTLVRTAVEGDEDDVIVAYSRDLRELRKTLLLNERLSKRANYDVLTGCLSRAYLSDKLTELFETTSEKEQISLTYLDLDDFKEVNDVYGHAAGDIALQRVVRAMVDVLPDEALVGRFGGDEFVIGMRGVSRSELQCLMDEIVQTVSGLELECAGVKFSTSVSMGSAFSNSNDRRLKDVLRRADAALYKAKNQGRNRGVITD